MKKILIILFLVFFLVFQAYPQSSSSINNTKSELAGFKYKNYLQLTLQTGFLNPVSPYFANHNYTSGNMGFDLSYRLNTEVAVYSEIKYNFLSSKDSSAPSSGYIETTIGARYYIRPSFRRSSIYFEAGFGPYIYVKGSSNKNVTVQLSDPFGSRMNNLTITQVQNIESQTNFRFGANIGVGAELVLTNSLFFTVKSKMNSVFESNGSITYITALGGFTIRF